MNKDKPRLFLALDSNGQRKNLDKARELWGEVPSLGYGWKINLDTVVSFDPDAESPGLVINELKQTGSRPIFLDLKMWNGGRTMSDIAYGATQAGVAIINVYAHAGPKFVRKVKAAVERASVLSGTQVYGLTVLSHYTDDDCKRLYGRNISDSVRMLAELAIDGGVDGLILPGNQLHRVSDLEVRKLCPAIRPTWYVDTKANDQEQTSTPEEAIDGGATDLVVGSPIFKSPSPALALERLLRDLSLV